MEPVKDVHHGTKQFKCSNCGEEFKYKSTLDYHLFSHKVNKPYTCEKCDATFELKILLTRHKQTHAKRNTVAKLTKASLLSKKNVLSRKTFTFRCSKCPIKCEDEDSLSVHMLDHENSYQCDKCPLSFSSDLAWEAHAESHEVNTKFVCDLCEAEFETCESLVNHQQDKNTPFKCTACDLEFICETFFTTHCATHSKARGTKRKRPNTNFERGLKTDDNETEKSVYENSFETIGLDTTRNAKRNVHKSKTITNDGANNVLMTFVLPVEEMRCEICEASFREKVDFDAHLSVHENSGKYHSCGYCKSFFRNKRMLVEHTRWHTGERPFTCSFCDKRYATHTLLKMHERNHTGYRPYSCQECFARFTSSSILKGHLRIHEGDSLINCELCGAKFQTVTSLKTHQIENGKPFLCQICGEDFVCRKLYVTHCQCHSGSLQTDSVEPQTSLNIECDVDVQEMPVRPVKCNLCNIILTDKEELKKHVLTHTGTNPWKCVVCGNSYKNRGRLDEHFRSHTKEKPFPCDFCAQTFATKSHLKIHIRGHTGDKPYSCNECLAKFKSSSILRSHLRIHEGKNLIKCGLCGARFQNLNSLRAHQVENGSALLCNICDDKFMCRKYFESHVLSHFEEENKTDESPQKPIKCNRCEKKFRNKALLNSHLLKHLREKPIQCPDCDITFDTNMKLKIHYFSHTKEKPYLCDFCGSGFVSKGHFKRHVKKHTGEIPWKRKRL